MALDFAKKHQEKRNPSNKNRIAMLAFQKYIYYLCSKPNTTKQLFRTGEELFEKARLKKILFIPPFILLLQ